MKETKNIKPMSLNWKSWLKRVGFIGFIFFLIKGLIWILIFTGIGNWFNK